MSGTEERALRSGAAPCRRPEGRAPSSGSLVRPGVLCVPGVHRPPLRDVDWDALDGFADRSFTQRRHWLEFVASFTGGEVLVAELHRGAELVGYFNGVLFRRCGIPIL